MTYSLRLTPYCKPGLFILFGLALLMTGCTNQQGILPNYQEDDLRERHQVKQQVVLHKLSVIPIGSKQNQLSPYDTNRIIGFVEKYKLSGLDRLTITYSGSQAAKPMVAALLKNLGETIITTKSNGSKSGPGEIVFSYPATQTVLDRNCEGNRTDEGRTLMVPNKTMGCAYTEAFSRQVDQPRDLIEPRQRDKHYYSAPKTNNTTSTSSNSSSVNSGTNPADIIKSILN